MPGRQSHPAQPRTPTWTRQPTTAAQLNQTETGCPFEPVISARYVLKEPEASPPYPRRPRCPPKSRY